MSKKYPGGVLSKTAPAPSGPYESSTASGIWSMEDVAKFKLQGTWPTAGLINNFIEDVFSTYLYTGNGSTQTITNGIDLAGKGGLVWTKSRGQTGDHALSTTALGTYVGNPTLRANQTSAAGNEFLGSGTYNSNGYTLPGDETKYNQNGVTYVSWTFREQPKFFDVVTYTGDGAASRDIAHSLGSAPGFVIVKRINAAGTWIVGARTSTGGSVYLALNETSQSGSGDTVNGGSVETQFCTPTTFRLEKYGSGVQNTNASGGSYVAYLFAHNAGGFGLTGTDNVISCGSYTGTGASPGPRINLGWEPQFILYKAASTTGDWGIHDSMRRLGVGTSSTSGSGNRLGPNTSGAESGPSNFANIDATGFTITPTVSDINGSGQTYIYIAIRRGPMKVPTTGTSVFGLNARTGTGANATVTGSAGVSDAVLIKNRGSAVADLFASRLTGTGYLVTSSNAVEVAAGTTILQANPWDVMDGVKVGTTSTITNASANTYINYLFDRAPGFFDVVCWLGDGVDGKLISHNLGVAPELVFYKDRVDTFDWWVVSPPSYLAQLILNDSGGLAGSSGMYNPTATTFTTASGFTNQANASGGRYVAYLFASCPGVSKVGNYIGNGSSRTINCGFTSGARFVMIKRIDAAGNWYVWDTARGIVAGNDPYLLLNNLGAEVTTNDSIDPDNTGFVVNQLFPTNINVNAATYIFLAIA